MKFGELQPYRVWFDYLKTCLLDENLTKNIDREYYKSWNLSEIKNSKFEIELNELYPIGRLYCEFCQNKHERKLIEKLKKSIESDLDIYDYPKYIVKLKKQEEEK